MRRCSRGSMRGCDTSATSTGRRSARASPRSSALLPRRRRCRLSPRRRPLRRVSPRALVRVDGASYSVPCRVGRARSRSCASARRRSTIVGRDGTRIAHPRKRFGSGRSTTATTCPSWRASRRRCARCCRICCAISGAPFPAVWEQLHAAHGPREAARLFAKILGELEARGAAGGRAGARGRAARPATPLLLALAPAPPPRAWPRRRSPAPLRDLDVASGCAADYDALAHGGAGMSRAASHPRSHRRADARPEAAGRRAQRLRALGRQARDAHWPHEDYLHEVLGAEQASRHESVIRQRLREARFPEMKTLDTFDFAAAEGVSATQIHTLARGEWVTRAGESDPRRADRHGQNAPGDRARRRGDEAEAARALYARRRSGPAAPRSARRARAHAAAAAAPARRRAHRRRARLRARSIASAASCSSI